jgi:hypothetical protein
MKLIKNPRINGPIIKPKKPKSLTPPKTPISTIAG